MARDPIADDDWRLMGQESYLLGATLFWRQWRESRPGWDHDHCEFCGVAISDWDEPDVLHHGYTGDDEYHWVCETCARDFAPRFRFRLIGGPAAT